MGLLDEQTWSGRIFTGGWQRSSGGDAAVVEPATGKELGRVGIAAIEDLTASAAQAEVGAALIEDPYVRVISFTGSTATGRPSWPTGTSSEPTWSWAATPR